MNSQCLDIFDEQRQGDDMPEAWRVLESEHVLTRPPWLTVRRDRVQLPNDIIIDDYYVLEYPTWINVLAITSSNQLIFVRQYRHALGKANYELPAGVVEPTDPDPLTAAKRELAEETGYGGGAWSLLLISSANPSTHSNLTHSFLAVGVEPIHARQPDTTEDLQLSVLEVATVRRLIENGEILQSLHLAPLLIYLLNHT